MMSITKERDAAFIDFVTTGNKDKLLAYCRKYAVAIPENEDALAGGVYKAVQLCVNIPTDIKTLAAEKCRALGMNPGLWR